jgi:hypothetical protein
MRRSGLLLGLADTDHAATITTGGACVIGLRAMGNVSATQPCPLWIDVDTPLGNYR